MRKRKASSGPAVKESEQLPPAHASLAAVHVATLTAAAFLAPKGVPCTLSHLAASVKALAGLELTPTALRHMVGVDAQLALRHAVSASGEVELELVLRESLRMLVTPGAVRSRHKRFRSLLVALTSSELPLAPLPPQPAGTCAVAAAASSVGGSPERRGVPTGASEATSPSLDTVGQPSPPPRPLRHANVAAALSPSEHSHAGESSGSSARASLGRSRHCATLEAADAPTTAHTIGDNAAEPAVSAPPTGLEGGVLSTVLRRELEGARRGTGAPASATLRFLRALHRSPFARDQAVFYHELPAKPARFATPCATLAPAVWACLQAAGRSSLYTHQVEAIDALMGGRHVMLCTPTASGKSIGYAVPTLHAMATDANARALFIFPTKALAQDQMRALRELSCAGGTALFGLPIHTYDGDTPQSERAQLRASARVILTNPDMLHCALLPHHHTEWADVLRYLKYVVIDEAHMYRGVFGAHVALILRRLRRLAALHGACPSFACCSATVGNAAELFEQLTGLQGAAVICNEGSPRGWARRLHSIAWRRRLLQPHSTSQRVRKPCCHRTTEFLVCRRARLSRPNPCHTGAAAFCSGTRPCRTRRHVSLTARECPSSHPSRRRHRWQPRRRRRSGAVAAGREMAAARKRTEGRALLRPPRAP